MKDDALGERLITALDAAAGKRRLVCVCANELPLRSRCTLQLGALMCGLWLTASDRTRG
jgi:hypothetical protein